MSKENRDDGLLYDQQLNYPIIDFLVEMIRVLARSLECGLIPEVVILGSPARRHYFRLELINAFRCHSNRLKISYSKIFALTKILCFLSQNTESTLFFPTFLPSILNLLSTYG